MGGAPAEAGDTATDYAYSPHWVSRAIRRIPIANPLLASIIGFGTIPNLVFVLYVLSNGHQVTTWFLIAQAFTVIALNVGPAVIWYYDAVVLPTFVEKLTELLADADRAYVLGGTYDELFSTKWVLGSIPITGLFVAAFLNTQGELAAAGVFDVGGPFYWALFGFVTWAGILGGIGFSGVAVTLLFIHRVADEELTIDPLHPDGLGGLGQVGYYAIRTTMAFSVASLFLPLAIQIAVIADYAVVVYTIVGLYTLFIALSFVYPTYRVHLRARELRERILDDLRHEYAAAKARLPPHDEVDGETTEDELLLELEVSRIRQEYEDYATVRLYPLQIDILLQLLGSVLLPIVFLVLEIYAQRLILATF